MASLHTRIDSANEDGRRPRVRRAHSLTAAIKAVSELRWQEKDGG